ncbi:MAG: cytochrome c [Bauldia sp.]
MTSSGRARKVLKWLFRSRPMVFATTLGGATIALTLTAYAQTAPFDPAAVAAGRGIWTSKANCQICHGWAGDGEKMDNQMPDGANLRETFMTRDQIVEAIKCGKPGLGMPAFDRTAYTANNKCYGMTRAELNRSGQVLADALAPLTDREINTVVDFLFAKIIGKGPLTRANCTDLFDKEVDVCKGLP